jgi:uncharacterized repeat protein (TIGR01451 family)
LLVSPCHADLNSTPAWFDANGVGSNPDWHYRVPVTIPANTPANSTIRVDVDFDTLLAAMGISGTFDTASPRMVRSDGTLATLQQFTDAVFMGATDALGNGRGEVRFILQDSGPVTYYLYFDITQNGAKTAWPAADTINGNFEFGTTGQTAPAGWTASATAGYDAQVRPGETPAISSDTTGPDTPFVTTDGSPYTGQFSYLLGARSQNEPGNADPAVTLSKTFSVPATNPGDVNLQYRLEGWDSSADFATQYDFIRIRLVGSTTVEVVGPTAGNYGIFPFAPNYGTNAASSSQAGYGQYNGWDTDTNGTHRYAPPMTVAPGSQPWFQVSASLNAFAGQTVTLEITSSHYNQYRSWMHVDDVQWSVVDGALGSPQAFGADVTSPVSAAAGSVLSIAAMADAQPDSMLALILDDTGSAVASGIVLFDDGTHGDAVAADGRWTNDGSDTGSPTHTIPAGATAGSNWTVTVLALDASNSTIAATDGLVHIPGQPAAPESQSNFFNVDTQTFTIVQPAADLSTSTKSVVDLTGGALYSGDTLSYTITLVESAGLPASNVRVTDAIPAHLSGFTVVSLPAGATDASTAPGTGPNGTGYLDITGIDLTAGGSDTIVFEASVAATAATGATIDNTAAITVPGGTGANPAVATIPVSAIPSGGNKQLYLRTTSELSRLMPASEANQRIRRNASHAWTLDPALQQSLIISAGAVSVPVRLMMRHSRSSSGNRSTAIDIDISGIGSLTAIPITVNGSVQSYTFDIPLASAPPITLTPGSAPVLTVSTSNEAIRVYTTYGGTPSRLLLDVDTVINVDSVAFYDAAYPGGSVITSTAPGGSVYIRAEVSDPFGSFDITGASVDITGPSGSTSDPMTQVQDSGAASKIYEVELPLPAFGSDGTWTAVVTASEGTEGTITHQGTAVLLVGAPLLTILKSASSATANPGDLITYTIQVVNAGTGPATAIVLDDAMSPYTALRIAYDGSDPLPFRLVGAPGGLTPGAPVYSDNDGATYGYGPLSSGGSGAPAGHDGSVTHWQLPMNGSLNGNGAGFSMRYQVVVK